MSVISSTYVWTDDREKIYRWIKEVLDLAIYADVYKGATYVLCSKTPGYVSFVCHACRDIINGLAKDYKGITRDRVDYVKLIDKLKTQWDFSWGVKSTISDEELTISKNIPLKTCYLLQEIVEEHNKGRERAEEVSFLFFQTFLDYKDKDKIPIKIIENWRESSKWFVKHAHSRKKSYDADVDKKLEKLFLDFEMTLLTAADSLTNRLKDIDAILEETN